MTVDSTTRFQTISSGWATSLRMWDQDKRGDRFAASVEQYADAVSTWLVDQVGINAVRVEIASGAENPRDDWAPFYSGAMTYSAWSPGRYEKVNDNSDPRVANLAGFQFAALDYRIERYLLPIKRAVEARGERLHINVNYLDFKWNAARQGTLSHANNAEEYAEFVLVHFQHLRDKYGLIPDSFEMILEPENTVHWRGDRIGAGLVAVAARLASDGFHPDFVGPSTTSMSAALGYFNKMVAVPGARGLLSTFSYHRYGGESAGTAAAIHAAAAATGVETAMLEKVNAGLDVLLEDLLVAQVSGWQQWAMAETTSVPDDGGNYARVTLGRTGASAIAPGRHTDQLAQVFLYARRGAVRIGSTSDRPDIVTVAFRNPNGAFSVVVRARGTGGLVAVEGLPGGRYGFRVTTDQGARTNPLPVTISAGSHLALQLPDASVATVYRMP